MKYNDSWTMTDDRPYLGGGRRLGLATDARAPMPAEVMPRGPQRTPVKDLDGEFITTWFITTCWQALPARETRHD